MGVTRWLCDELLQHRHRATVGRATLRAAGNNILVQALPMAMASTKKEDADPGPTLARQSGVRRGAAASNVPAIFFARKQRPCWSIWHNESSEDPAKSPKA